ncbi:MAG: PLP-dependent aminotransferase family protein [Methanobacteriota archaeon]
MAIGFSHLFSERARAMKASEIRELLKVTQKKGVISFAGGLPNPAAFPVEQIKEISERLLAERPEEILQYGTTEGVTELRRAIAERMVRKGIECTEKNVLITQGSQQGLDLISKVFLDPRNLVITGFPTYLGAANSFAAYQAQMEGIPLDDDGMPPDLLEEKLWRMHRHGRNSKMLYLVPTFQNPSGVTMTESRRRKMLEIAAQHDLLVIEDDPYSDIRFEGDEVKPMKSFDKDGRVIYLGTFSKILAPGLRVAWAIGPEEMLAKMIIAKQSTDLCSNTFGQWIAHEYLASGQVEPHVAKICQLYKRKRDIMLGAMKEHFPEGAAWTRPQGGMFTWATLPAHIDTREMFQQALGKNVAYVIGSAFFPDHSGRNTMRLNFTYPTDEDLVEGVKRLAGVIREEMSVTSTQAKKHVQEKMNGMLAGV